MPRFKLCVYCLSLVIALIVWKPVTRGQAPPAIQIFMPDGSLPTRNMRLTLTRDDGRIETVFTDTKGKYQVTGDLIREADYIVTVESDGRTFDTTTARFRIIRSTPVYTPVFLQPYTSKTKPPPGAIDVAALDVNVPIEARTAYEEAMKAVGSGNSAEAMPYFQKAISLYPPYLRALNDLGVLYLKLNRLDDASRLFEQAIKIDRRFYFARLNLGVILNRQGNYKKAAETLSALYDESRSLRGLPSSYADALIGTGQLSKAEKVLRTALADTGMDLKSQVDIHFKLGLVLSREERFAEAVVYLEKTVTLDPNAANAHLVLGGSLLQLNRLPEAEKWLTRAYALGGSAVASAQMFLGQLYLMQRNPEAALGAFELYLKDMPAAPNSARIKIEISKLKATLNKE